MTEMDNIISGQWKFKDIIKVSELLEVAKEWESDPNYIHLYVRRCSKDQYGLGFAYRYNGDKEEYKKFFDETSDKLKRRFGNDLAGWDISSHTKAVKGF